MTVRVSALMLWLVVVPAAARAFDLGALWNPFKTPVERLAQDVADARARGELDLAQSLLEAAERLEGAGHPALTRERGLLARDRGRLAEAAEILGRAADLDPTSNARLEQAAVLVPLGRWPETVEILDRAFADRGAGLRAGDVMSDPRFMQLSSFPPFQDLVGRIRAEQAGPWGRVLLKLERVEEAVRGDRDVLEMLGRWLGAVSRLGEYVGTAVTVLLGFGLLVTFGIAQTGLLRPPWTLVTGMIAASGLWHLGARIATGESDAGLRTAGVALAVVLAPWALVLAGRRLWRWRRERRRRDAFDPAELPRTLLLLDELRAAVQQALEAPAARRAPALAKLRQLGAAWSERLGLVEGAANPVPDVAGESPRTGVAGAPAELVLPDTRRD